MDLLDRHIDTRMSCSRISGPGSTSLASIHRVATIPQAPSEFLLHCDGFVALVGMPRRQSAPGGAGDGGDNVVSGETGDQTRSGIEKRRPRAAANVTAMDITIHASLLPHDDPSVAGQARSSASFIARGRSSNGRSEHEANAQEEAMPKR